MSYYQHEKETVSKCFGIEEERHIEISNIAEEIMNNGPGKYISQLVEAIEQEDRLSYKEKLYLTLMIGQMNGAEMVREGLIK